MIAFSYGSPFAAVGAACGILVALRVFLPGALGVFNFQRSTITGLQEELDGLTKKLHAAELRIVELQTVILQTRDLQPILDSIEAHEGRAATRHESERTARKRETEATLGILQQIADRMPPEPNGH